MRARAGHLLWAFLFLAVGIAALGANPFRGETITPVDILISQRAWSFVDPGVKVRSYERSDILNSRLPQWESAKARLRAGELPLWNDRIAGGGTFLTVNSNIFTPAFAIFALTPDPALGFYLAMLADLAIAGMGMFLFLRRHVGVFAAVCGGVTFELCGFVAAWLYWPHVFTIIWAPWLLWSIDRIRHQPGPASWAFLALSTALVACGGFPFLSVLVLEAGALYALLNLFHWQPAGRWTFAGGYAAGTLFGLLLAALPLIGLYYWLQQFDIGYRYGRGSYLGLADIKQLFPPWAYRSPRVERAMYIGVPMLACAGLGFGLVVAKWRRMSPAGPFAVLLFLACFALVFELWPMWLVGCLPGMAYNSWSRAIGLMSIALIILGSMGLHWLWSRARNAGRRWALACLAIAAFVGVVENFAIFRDFNGPVSARYYFPKTPTIEYAREHAGPFDYVITDRSFVMSGTLGVYGLREWLGHYFRSPELQRALRGMAKRPFNTHRASASRFAASGIKYGSPTLDDFNVRYALVSSDFVAKKLGIDQAALEAGSANGSIGGFHHVFTSHGTSVLENPRVPRGPYFIEKLGQRARASYAKTITVLDYAPELFRLRYEGNKPGFVVVPMSHNDDWTVEVDGTLVEVEFKRGVMPAVPVSGACTISFRYVPSVARLVPAWTAAVLVSAAAMLATAVFVRRRRRPGRPPDDAGTAA